MADFDKAIEIDPKYYIAYNDRAWLKYILEEYKEAMTDYNHVLKIKHDFELAKNNRNMLEKKIAECKAIISENIHAAKVNPVDPGAYYEIAIAQYKLGNVKDGCKNMTTALHLGSRKAQNALEHFCH